jgi:hypothetical protein
MAWALLAYDVVHALLATALYGGAAAAFLAAFDALSRVLPAPLALFPALVVALLALIAEVGALTALSPTLEPGRYPMFRGKVFFSWVLRGLLRRILFVPGLKWVLFTSNTLRYLALKALGARVAFSTTLSNDVDLVDPSLLHLERGATLGARSYVAGHYLENGKLFLAEVRIGEGAMVAFNVSIGPGATVGAKAVIRSGASIGARAQVGEGAIIGPEAGIDAFAVVEPGAKVATREYVRPRAKVRDLG